MITLLIEATFQTLVMIIVSTVVGLLIGLPLAVLLFSSDNKGLYENPVFNKIAGFIVNAVRSVPYIILIIALIPLTRLISGSSIGTTAACVPLSIAAIMLIARVGEESLKTVPKGLIEAALSMGASRLQIILKVLLPECLPSLIGGMTLVIISLIGFSAMAGAVGGGGLGDLAIRYGYQRYQTDVVFQIVLILITMVQGIQMSGDWLARRLEK
tara:strand:+ start:556 stop:1194 length:639 start_codon:yes stop_codon:yes gene_type:complete